MTSAAARTGRAIDADAASFCPYVGLQPYAESHRDYFFGRERDIRIIANNLLASPLTVLYGASGVGKSSVLLAGVIPAMRAKPRIAVVTFREWQRPDLLAALRLECAAAAMDVTFARSQGHTLVRQPVGSAAPEAPSAEERGRLEAARDASGAQDELTLPGDVARDGGLDETLQQLAAAVNGRVLVIFDQFEEYFLYHPEGPRNTFDAELARAVNREEVDAGFLLALREDGLARLDRFRARIPHLLANMLRLRHLDAAAAERAIREPLRIYNEHFGTSMTIDDALVREVLAQARPDRAALAPDLDARTGTVDEREAIETPFLQLVMTKVWDEERKAASSTLRVATLERLGGAAEIVRTHLDAVMERLAARQQALCAAFFDRLVTPSGSKIACRLDDLEGWAGKLAPELPAVLQALGDARILRTIAPVPGGAPVPQYEIFHDVLAPAILGWRRRYLYAREQEELRQAEEERRRREREDREAQLARDKARMQRRALGALMSAFLVVTALAIYAFHQSRVAARERKLAEARLERIVDGIELKQAFLSGNREAVDQALATAKPVKIRFEATRTPREVIGGQQYYEWRVFPVPETIAGGWKGLVTITYWLDHPSFPSPFFATGANQRYTASYIGYGCLRQVRVLIEYADPEKVPAITSFDMCATVRDA